MDSLWEAVYGRLSATADLFHLRAPDDYEGVAEAAWAVGKLRLIDSGNSYEDIAEFTVDVYALGDDTARGKVETVANAIRDRLLDWYVQDSSDAGASGPWLLEVQDWVDSDDMRRQRMRLVFSSVFVGSRVVAAH